MKKSGTIIFFILFMGLSILIFLSRDSKEENKLKKYGVTSIAYVTRIEPVLKEDGLWVSYNFSTGNTIHKNRIRLFVESKYKSVIGKLLLDKSLPMVYDSSDLNNNKIMLLRNDYLIYDYPIPDSMQHIINKIDSLKF